MRVALFIPCYVDQLLPDVGLAAAEVLERHGCEVVFPEAQTCCGQPLLNAGGVAEAEPLARRMAEVFDGYEHVVCPGSSCVATIRVHYRRAFGASPALDALAVRSRELCEFLWEVLGVRSVEGRFDHRVGLHPSCHGLRELRLGTASERMADASVDPARALLDSLTGLAWSEPERADECCGFGGTFAVTERAVSARMGRDRLAAHVAAGTEIVTATDASCLAHMDGLARRDGLPLRTMHVAEILAGREPAPR